MRLSRITAGLLIYGCFWSAMPTCAETPGTQFLPDRSRGYIDGQAAVWAAPSISGPPTEAVDPTGFSAHVTPDGDLDDESIYPCGSWFLLPSGQGYRMWVEHDWLISAWPMRFSYEGVTPMVIPLSFGPAGRVRVSSDFAMPDTALELLHLGPHTHHEMVRRSATGAMGSGLLMPEGQVIASLWDPVHQRYVAISRPFDVGDRKSVVAPLSLPGARAQLVVKAHLPRVSDGEEMSIALKLKQDGKERFPEVVVRAPLTTYGYWYELTSGPVVLEAETANFMLPPETFEIGAGKIAFSDRVLRPKPSLDVAIEVPSLLAEEELKLVLRRLPDGQVIDQAKLLRGGTRHRFYGLPSALLEVELHTSLGAFKVSTDLRSGDDGYVLLQPQLIGLTGTVFLGDEPHPALLSLETVARTIQESKTDAEGHYQIVLLHPLRSVTVTLEGVRSAPYWTFFADAIDESRELDFRVPAGEFVVRVLDASTGRPILGAKVITRNSFRPTDLEGNLIQVPAEAKETVLQTATSDLDGLAFLPPQRAGRLEIRAGAEGYSNLEPPEEHEITDSERGRLFEISLKPLGTAISVSVLLPNGLPAEAADLMLIDSLDTARALFTGRTDKEGRVALPEKLSGLLLIKHPLSGFAMSEWLPRPGQSPNPILLPSAAESPVLLEVRDCDGDPYPRAEITLWINGRTLAGSALFFLTGSFPFTDQNGFWNGSGLPRQSITVLASSPSLRDQVKAGMLNAEATSVSYPWPERVELQAAE